MCFTHLYNSLFSLTLTFSVMAHIIFQSTTLHPKDQFYYICFVKKKLQRLVFIFNLSVSVPIEHISLLLGDIRFGITQQIKMNVFNGDICIPLNGPSLQLNDFFSLDYCIHIIQHYPWGNNTLNLSLEVVGWPYTFFIGHKRC